ncbi:MAG: hypothetical protein KKF68_00990 [Nanoarchaeota archaeon]|nr:hypothetical protein [Nanoarchaeota archaeon]
MKTKFLIDPKVEAENIPKLLKLAGRRVLFPPFAKRIINKKGKKLYKEIYEIHEENKKEIKKLKITSKSSWKKIEKDYTNEMEKLTGHKLIQNKSCYFAPTINGIADIKGRKNVFVGMGFNKDTLKYIIPHELTHLHYTDILYKAKLYEAGKSPLMEGVNHLILFKTPIKNLIKSNIEYPCLNFVQQNHNFMKDLEKAWEKRKDFTSFLKEAIKIQRKNKNIKHC